MPFGFGLFYLGVVYLLPPWTIMSLAIVLSRLWYLPPHNTLVELHYTKNIGCIEMGEDEQQILHPVQVYIVIDPVDIRSVSVEEKQTTLVRIFCFTQLHQHPINHGLFLLTHFPLDIQNPLLFWANERQHTRHSCEMIRFRLFFFFFSFSMILISLISGFLFFFFFFGLSDGGGKKETPLFPFFCPSALPGCRLVYYEIASNIKTSVLRYYCLVSGVLCDASYIGQQQLYNL